jgi:diadenosine tetraphosphate (Ap4A) HIT family hydrolase
MNSSNGIGPSVSIRDRMRSRSTIVERRFASMTTECVLCLGPEADPDLFREEVWRDDLWRLTTAKLGEVAGFSYLEPFRHIETIADLDGAEAASLGEVLARASSAIRDTAGVDLVYVYVFGDGIPHLHLHLAPHREDGPLSNHMIKGNQHRQTLPDGADIWVSDRYPLLSHEIMDAAIDGVRRRMTETPSPRSDGEVDHGNG